MHPVPGTITERRQVRATTWLRRPEHKRQLARRARSFGESPRQIRDRLNGFSKD